MTKTAIIYHVKDCPYRKQCVIKDNDKNFFVCSITYNACLDKCNSFSDECPLFETSDLYTMNDIEKLYSIFCKEYQNNDTYFNFVEWLKEGNKRWKDG